VMKKAAARATVCKEALKERGKLEEGMNEE
jgi:hypothetical protein